MVWTASYAIKLYARLNPNSARTIAVCGSQKKLHDPSSHAPMWETYHWDDEIQLAFAEPPYADSVVAKKKVSKGMKWPDQQPITHP